MGGKGGGHDLLLRSPDGGGCRATGSTPPCAAGSVDRSCARWHSAAPSRARRPASRPVLRTGRGEGSVMAALSCCSGPKLLRGARNSTRVRQLSAPAFHQRAQGHAGAQPGGQQVHARRSCGAGTAFRPGAHAAGRGRCRWPCPCRATAPAGRSGRSRRGVLPQRGHRGVEHALDQVLMVGGGRGAEIADLQHGAADRARVAVEPAFSSARKARKGGGR
jgi:hypothetical protein